MNYVCGDNRFEIIERYKKELTSATNIESSPDEMAVLDNILFRFWQMGWLKEQETKLICNLLGGPPYEVYCRECRTILCILCKGKTMNDLKSVFSYCTHCGRAVKWE